MPNSTRKFRILRSNSGATAPETKPGDRPLDANGDEGLQDRIEAAVRNRVAHSKKEAQSAPMANDQNQSGQMDPASASAVVDPAAAESLLTPRQEIQKIKEENLTGRELRIARRVAQKNGLQPTSDLDAVRLLRKRGIDPFNRGEIVSVMGAGGVSLDGKSVALPATLRKTAVTEPAPRPQVIDDDTREREIWKIQRGLVKRRRKRLAVLMVKLACFIGLPSLIAGYYFYGVATPMYATYSQFVIQKADAPGSVSRGLLGGTPMGVVTDSITVQGYLNSRDALRRLDEGPGFRKLFQADTIDALQRLDPNSTDEAAYGIYEKNVIIGFDPTEGVIKMEVITPSPKSSLEISMALIGYAEERVDQQTKRLRGDQMRGAQENYDKAEREMEQAQNRVAELQIRLNTFDPGAAFQLVMNQISGLEDQVLQKQLALSHMNDNASPNKTKLRVLKREIELLELKLAEKRRLVTQGTDNKNSIVKVNSELTKANNNLALRQDLMAVSLQNLETARSEANRQTRYLSMGVSPVQPDEATYPRAFENTLLSIVVFAGIYLMLSLTVSILREQVTT